MKLPFERDDGGRADAGYKGTTGDCVTRAIAIATGLNYQTIYDAINDEAKRERPGARRGNNTTRSSARTGVYKGTYKRYVNRHLELPWTATMQIGSGCQVHLREDELPSGRLIVKVSKHLTAVIDGVTHDIYDPSRDGTRCVYGYWDATAFYENLKAT